MDQVVAVGHKLGRVPGLKRLALKSGDCCCGGSSCPPPAGDCSCDSDWISDAISWVSTNLCGLGAFQVDFCDECCGVGFTALASLFATGSGERTYPNTSCAFGPSFKFPFDLTVEVPATQKVYDSLDDLNDVIVFPWSADASGLVRNSCTIQNLQLLAPPFQVQSALSCPKPFTIVTGAPPLTPSGAPLLHHGVDGLMRAATSIGLFNVNGTGHCDIPRYLGSSLLLPPGSHTLTNCIAIMPSSHTGTADVTQTIQFIDSPGSRIIVAELSGVVDAGPTGLVNDYIDTFTVSVAAQIATTPAGYCDAGGLGMPFVRTPRPRSLQEALRQMHHRAGQVEQMRRAAGLRAGSSPRSALELLRALP